MNHRNRDSRYLPAGILTGLVASLALAVVTSAAAQNYPNRPIRIVTAAAGANLDFSARLIGAGVSEKLGQPVIVENRSSGVVPMQIVAKAPADGYTLLLYGSTFWIGPLLKHTPYDPIKDFSPISLTNRQPNVAIVHPSLEVHSIKELITLAKARSGEMNYASGATGSITHLAAELFSRMAGIQMTRISYTSASTQIGDVMAGRVRLMFGNGSQVIQAIKSGKVRALAVCSREPSPLYPGLPTVESAGLPGYESVGMTGVFAPAKTPPPIIRLLNEEIVRALGKPEVRQTFFVQGGETVGSSPEVLLATIKAEMARMGKVIKEANIREE